MKTCFVFFLLSFCLFFQSACQQGNQSQSSVIQAGNFTILDTRTDLTDRARAKQNVEDALIAHPELDGLIGLWAYNGPAILSAVKDANLQGNIQIVSFDEEEDILQGIADGYVYGTVVQQPFEFGYQAVRILAALAKGDQSVLPEHETLVIPVRKITSENVAQFRETLQNQLASGTEAAASDNMLDEPETEVAFISNNVADFWRIAHAGVKKAEADFGVTCHFMMPPNGTADDQRRLIETMISRNVSGLAISVNDPLNQRDILNEAAEVMNVITQDNDAPGSNRLAYVGSDNYLAGREAGKLVREALPDGGEVMFFVGQMDAQNAIERRQGVIDELMELPIPARGE